ncbi:MAG: hypothetical protein J6W25_03045 [Bacilli bacterium]|nr:hypothetical protein [Bacilli bacterium]
MEDKELEELLKLDIPNIEGNKDKVLEACKARNVEYNKKLTRRIYYIPSFVVLSIITILSIVLLSNRESIDISKINKAINNLEYIDNDEEKMIAIMNIEKDIQNVSADKQEKINIDKLTYANNITINNLKNSVEWKDCLNDNDNYTSLDKIFNINEITDIRMIKGRFSSVMWEFNKAFYSDLLLKFDLPYINIIDKADSFHNEYKDILSGEYNNEYTFYLKSVDDSRTIQIRVYDSGYVLISITERNGTDVYDVELKSLFISLIPQGKIDYLDNYIKKEYDIKQSYVDAYLSGNYPAGRVLIEKYYGNYNGYDVVLIKLADYGDTGMTKDVVIGNVTFHYLFSNREILLWTGNIFYKLSEAYEKGLVTEEDLTLISEYHNKK